MIKPMKQYDTKYAKNKNCNEGNIQKEEIYMCEYVDAYVKRPLPEDSMMSLDFDFGF